jgi:hypothetical protein
MNFKFDLDFNKELVDYLCLESELEDSALIDEENRNKFINKMIYIGFNIFKNNNSKNDLSISRLEKNIDNKINELKNSITNFTSTINKPSKKGQLGERIIFKTIQKDFSNQYNIVDNTKKNHSGDILLEAKNDLVIYIILLIGKLRIIELLYFFLM